MRADEFCRSITSNPFFLRNRPCPRPRKELDEFKAEIQLQFAEGQSYNDIRRWLAGKGVRISKTTLCSRVVEWQGKTATTLSSDINLVSEVDSAFHATHHDDKTIAANVNAIGIPTTHRQVKRIRLAHGWRRRSDTNDQLADSRAETFALAQTSQTLGKPSYAR